MASASQSVQQGFFLGFSQVATYFAASIDLSSLLKALTKAMERQPQALKPSENCQRVIGEALLLRGVASVFFKQARETATERYQKNLHSLDEFMQLVARLYE